MKAMMTLQRLAPAAQRGMSLIELMISILLGMLVMGAIFAIFGISIRSSADMVANARLNQDVSTVMTIMGGEIKRAGYNASGESLFYGPSDGSPTLYADFADITIVNDGCILYSRDRDHSSTLEAEEFRGFKLKDNSVWMRTGCDIGTGDLDETNACFVGETDSGAQSCNTGDDRIPTDGAGAWERLIDPDVVEITDLTFRLGQSKCVNADTNDYWIVTADSDLLTWPCYAASNDPDGDSDTDIDYYVYSATADSHATGGFTAPAPGEITIGQRRVNITLTGRLANDTAVQKTMTTIARVRNSRIRVVPAPPTP